MYLVCCRPQPSLQVTVRSRAAADAVMHNAGRLVSDVGAAELTAALSTAFEQAGVEVRRSRATASTVDSSRIVC